MSKNKSKKKFGHGGARKGAGHPATGITKKKICVSVDKKNWKSAVDQSKKIPSRLVDWLISRYLNGEAGMEAAI